jgi:hypothetical protein
VETDRERKRTERETDNRHFLKPKRRLFRFRNNDEKDSSLSLHTHKHTNKHTHTHTHTVFICSLYLSSFPSLFVKQKSYLLILRNANVCVCVCVCVTLLLLSLSLHTHTHSVISSLYLSSFSSLFLKRKRRLFGFKKCLLSRGFLYLKLESENDQQSIIKTFPLKY